MRILEFKKSRIGRRKSKPLVDNSTNNSTSNCVLKIRAIKQANIIAEEYERIGGKRVDVSELAKQISSDYSAPSKYQKIFRHRGRH